jgi:hypothetical protein
MDDIEACTTSERSGCEERAEVRGFAGDLWRYSMRNLVAAAALALTFPLSLSAQAQTAIVTQPFVASPTVTPAAPVQQPIVTVPNVVNTLSTLRGAGLGAGGLTSLCSDPLDPPQFTNECSAAGIGQ